VPAAVDEGLGGRHALRWPFDADLAVATLDWTTVDVPLLHWQLKFLHHSTPFPGLRSKELWYSSVLKSSSSKKCSSFSSCASRTSPTAVAIIHSITEEAHYRKLVFLRSHIYTVPERMQAGLFTGLPRRVLLGNWAAGTDISRRAVDKVYGYVGESDDGEPSRRAEEALTPAIPRSQERTKILRGG
jgi:hypothetical protein